MAPTDFSAMNCSMAKTLAVLGERWTMLVLREAFFGTRRFDDFRARLGVAGNILSARLDSLVNSGVMRREQYQDHPPRFEYRLTEKGRALHPVLLAVKAWGDRWTDAAEAPPLQVRHECGELFDVVTTCPHCGGEAHAYNVVPEPGPGASVDDIAYFDRLIEERRERSRARG